MLPDQRLFLHVFFVYTRCIVFQMELKLALFCSLGFLRSKIIKMLVYIGGRLLLKIIRVLLKVFCILPTLLLILN